MFDLRPGMSAPRAALFSGGTPFAISMVRLFGHCDDIGEWLVPAEHLVSLEEAPIVKELLEEERIPFSVQPEFIRSPD